MCFYGEVRLSASLVHFRRKQTGMFTHMSTQTYIYRLHNFYFVDTPDRLADT